MRGELHSVRMAGSKKVEQMRKGKMRCKASGCEKPPYLGGFCEAHHKEDRAKARRRDEAIDLLFRGVVDDDLLRIDELREELERLQRWWQRACQEMRSPGTDTIFGNEAEYAFEWCVILAGRWSRRSAQRAKEILQRPFGSRTLAGECGRDSEISNVAR